MVEGGRGGKEECLCTYVRIYNTHPPLLPSVQSRFHLLQHDVLLSRFYLLSLHPKRERRSSDTTKAENNVLMRCTDNQPAVPAVPPLPLVSPSTGGKVRSPRAYIFPAALLYIHFFGKGVHLKRKGQRRISPGQEWDRADVEVLGHWEKDDG